MVNRWGYSGQTLFFGGDSKITANGDCSHEIKKNKTNKQTKKTLAPWKKSYDQPRQHIKKQRYDFANECPCSQSYGFSTSHVWMWELDYKESWAPKNLCFWAVVLEKTLESPLNFKEIQPVHPKGDQSWVFIGRTDAEIEAPILWPPDAKRWLIGKDHDAGKDWRQEEKVMTEDKIVGWHHRLKGHEFEQALGVGDGQGSLECCSPWGRRQLDITEQLNWTELIDGMELIKFCFSRVTFWYAFKIIHSSPVIWILTFIVFLIYKYGLISEFSFLLNYFVCLSLDCFHNSLIILVFCSNNSKTRHSILFFFFCIFAMLTLLEKLEYIFMRHVQKPHWLLRLCFLKYLINLERVENFRI